MRDEAGNDPASSRISFRLGNPSFSWNGSSMLPQMPPPFAARRCRLLRRHLPAFAGRPTEDSMTRAAGLRKQKRPWKEIYPLVIPGHAVLGPAVRRQAGIQPAFCLPLPAQCPEAERPAAQTNRRKTPMTLKILQRCLERVSVPTMKFPCSSLVFPCRM